MYFEYGEKETDYLKSRDKKLGEAIDRIGHIYRKADPDLFFLCHSSYHRAADFYGRPGNYMEKAHP